MAKKINDKYEFDIDNIDDYPFGEPFDDVKEPSNNRSPITEGTQGFFDGVGSALKDTANYKTLALNMLPKGYTTAYDLFDHTVNEGTGLYQGIASDIKPVVAGFKTLGRSVKSSIESVLPESLSKRLDEILKENKDNNRYNYDEIDPAESAIQEQLISIFETQDEMARQDKTDEIIKDTIENKREDLRYKQIEEIRKDIRNLTEYQRQISSSYQRKSLETQLRSFFALRELVEVTKATSKESVYTLREIRKNTGLPDFVKMRDSEHFHEMAREKLFGKLQDKLAPTAKEFVTKLTKNLRGNISEWLSNLSFGLDITNDGIQANKDDTEFEAESTGKSTTYVSSKKVAKGLSGRAAGYLGKKLKPIVAKHAPTIVTTGNRAQYYVDNVGQILKDKLENTYSSNPFINSFQDAALDALASKEDNRLPTLSIDKLSEFTQWTNRSDNTLNVIIPGWLSRIHQSIEKLSSDGEVDRLTYDYKTDDYIPVKDLSKRYKEEFVSEWDINRSVNDSTDIINKIDKGEALSIDSRKALQNIILSAAKNKRGFTPEHFTDEYELTKYGASPAQANEISDVLRDYLDIDIFGKMNNTVESTTRLKELSDSFISMQSSIPDIRDFIKLQAYSGNRDALRNADLIKSRHGTDYINSASYLDRVNSIIQGTTNNEPTTSVPPSNGPVDSYTKRTGNPFTGYSKTSGEEDFSRSGHQRRVDKSTAFKTDDDVYADNSSTTGLTEEGLKAGRYTSALTGKVINSVKEIDGDVIDTFKNDTILKFNDLQNTLKRNTRGFSFKPPSLNVFKNKANQFKSVASDKIHSAKEMFSDVELPTIDTSRFEELSRNIFNDSLTLLNSQKEEFKTVFENLSDKITDGSFVNSLKTPIDENTEILRKIHGLVEILSNSDNDKTEQSILNDLLTEMKSISGMVNNINAHGVKGLGGSANTDGDQTNVVDDPRWKEGGEIGAAWRKIKRGAKKTKDIGWSVVKPFWRLGGIISNTVTSVSTNLLKIGRNAISSTLAVIKALNPIELATKAVKFVSTELFKGARAPFKYGAKALKNLRNLLNRTPDVYVPGESSPRLLSGVLRAGGYYSAVTGNTIYKLSDIDGDVKSKQTDQVVLSLDEYRNGVIDKDGNPIRSLGRKVLGFAGNTIKGTLNVGLKAAKYIGRNLIQGGKDSINFLKAGLKLPGKLVGGVHVGGGGKLKDTNIVASIDRIYNLLTLYFKSKGEDFGTIEKEVESSGVITPDTDSVSGTSTPVAKRRSVKSMFSEKMSMLKNRTGSWLNLMNDRKNKVKESIKAAPEKVKEKGKGLLSLLKGFFGTLLTGVGTLIGLGKSALSSLLNIGKFVKAIHLARAAGAIGDLLGGGKRKLGRLGGRIATGAKSLGGKLKGGLSKAGNLLKNMGTKSTLLRAAGWAGRAALSLGGAAIGILTSPITLTAAAIGITGYAAYKFFTRNKLLPWQRLRMAQYGLTHRHFDEIVTIAEMETMLLPLVKYGSNNSANIIGEMDTTKLFEMFNIDPNNRRQVNNWVRWFNLRFKPVFLTYAISLKLNAPTVTLQEMDNRLSSPERKSMAKAVSVIKNSDGKDILTETVSPFKDITLVSDRKYIDSLLDDVLSKNVVTDMLKGDTKLIDEKVKENQEKYKAELKKAEDLKKSREEKERKFNATFMENHKTLNNNTNIRPLRDFNYKERGQDQPNFATVASLYEALPKVLGNRPDDYNKLFDAVADLTGVSKDTLSYIAQKRSGFNSSFKSNESTSEGLFGMLASDWRLALDQYGPKYGVPENTPITNATAAALITALRIKDETEILKSHLPMEPVDRDILLAHIVGGKAAGTMLQQDDKTSIENLIPGYAKAEKSLFYNIDSKAKTVKELKRSLSEGDISPAQRDIRDNDIRKSIISTPNEKLPETLSVTRNDITNALPTLPSKNDYTESAKEKQDNQIRRLQQLEEARIKQQQEYLNSNLNTQQESNSNLASLLEKGNNTSSLMLSELTKIRELLYETNPDIGNQSTSSSPRGKEVRPAPKPTVNMNRSF